MTRMDLPLLLGTVVTENRRKARAIGYVMHFVLGIAVRRSVRRVLRDHRPQLVVARRAARRAARDLHRARCWSACCCRSCIPRMATPDTAANEITLIEPPGFLMLNYGRNTFLVTLAAHVVYGALVGLIVRL